MNKYDLNWGHYLMMALLLLGLIGFINAIVQGDRNSPVNAILFGEHDRIMAEDPDAVQAAIDAWPENPGADEVSSILQPKPTKGMAHGGDWAPDTVDIFPEEMDELMEQVRADPFWDQLDNN
jgi:hypothetical protein